MVEPSLWHVTSFYRFLPLAVADLAGLQGRMKDWMTERDVMGLVIFAEEGINGTVAGSAIAIADFKLFVIATLQEAEIRFKDSVSEFPPFRRISVDIRSEIVGLKRPDLKPDSPENSHLSPSEWHAMITSSEPKLVIDTRNRYETISGKFRGAIDPGLASFSEWGEYLDKAGLPKDQPVMIYCTGGIRCEKAILEMRARGFDEVYQLRDGILGYLEEFPQGEYEGECYVFDDRVCLGPDLLPSHNYGVCPGCGLTSGEKKQCAWCGESYFHCQGCVEKWPPVCSKTCRDRYERHGSKTK